MTTCREVDASARVDRLLPESGGRHHALDTDRRERELDNRNAARTVSAPENHPATEMSRSLGDRDAARLTAALQWIATAAVLLALATVGWDRFANVFVGSFNVKLPVMLFSLGLVTHLAASAPQFTHRPMAWRDRDVLTVVGATALTATLLLLILSSLFALDSAAGFMQIITIVLGAVVPFLATVSVTRPGMGRWALDAFIVGGIVSALFGLYQLIAAVSGLPQLIDYPALGGGLPRISSFNYEAGYFGYYMVLVMAALAARYRMTTNRLTHLTLGAGMVFILAVTLLANTRAAYMTIPLFGLALWASRRRSLPNWKQLGIGAGGLVAAGVIVVVIAPAAVEFLAMRAASILDPTEPTSNAPRLQLLQGALRIYADHPFLGIGPGNLVNYVSDYDLPFTGGTSNSVIVNNVPLQALLDGGPLLLSMQVALVVVLFVRSYRWDRIISSALVSGLAAVALIAFAGTSYFWDLKLWAVAALAWGMAGHPPTHATADPVPAGTEIGASLVPQRPQGSSEQAKPAS